VALAEAAGGMGCGPSGVHAVELKKTQGLLQEESLKSDKLLTELQVARVSLLKLEQDNSNRLRSDLVATKDALEKAAAELKAQQEAAKAEQKAVTDYRSKVVTVEASLTELKAKITKEREHVQKLEEDLNQIRNAKPAKLQDAKDLGSNKNGKGAGAKSVKVDPKKEAKKKGGDPIQVVRTNLIIDHGKETALSQFYDMSGVSLGEGAFGTVWQAKHKKSKEIRAIKSVPVNKMQTLEREISLMKMMDHLNVIRLYETFMDSKALFLVMELCDGGELFATLVEKDMLSENEAAVTLQQVFRAVHHMHERKVVHRDLKPENLMLQGKGEISKQVLKVIDLGLAVQFTPGVPLTSRCGTPVYMAPEQVQGCYDERVDVWACGCIMYVLLSGCLPFDGDDEDEVFDKILAGNFILDPYYWTDVSKDAQQLCRWMLTYVSEGRATAQMALHHKWVTKTAPQIKEALPNNVLANLRNNRQRNLLKKAALQVIALNMSKEKLEKLPEIFLTLDIDQNGMLSAEELSVGLKKIECGDASWLMSILPGDGGEISYTEFIAAAMDKAQYLQKDVCMAAFQVFDKDGSGTITKNELSEVLGGKPGDKPGTFDKAVEGILLEVDKSGDGVIDFDEFMEMMRAVGRNSAPIVGEMAMKAKEDSHQHKPKKGKK